MFFFDPTINWSRELLDPPVPDLLVVQSSSNIENSSPWSSSAVGSSWSTPWIEYATVDSEERYIIMTLFDTRVINDEDKGELVSYSEVTVDGERALGWYKCTSAMRDCFESLSKSYAIDCHKLLSPSRRSTADTSNAMFEFRKMVALNPKLALGPAWDRIMIGPSKQFCETDFAEQLGWDVDHDPPAGDIAGEATTMELAGQVDVLTLYTVGSFNKVGAGALISGATVDEDSTIA